MGRYITTTGTAGSVVRTISTTYSALVNDRIICTAGGFNISLPSSNTAIDGDTIQVIDATGAFGASNVTLLRTGSSLPNIMGQAADLLLNINYCAVTLTYTTAYGWIVSGK
jgi:hypothetical protein